MKNKFIKLISLITLLATVLVCFAACGGGQQIAPDAKGTIGDIEWDFRSSNQTLTLSGTGDMKDLTQKYVTETNEAWNNIRSSVKTVVIENGITSIGAHTFYGMYYLSSVSIPSSVTKIGKCAFAFCTSLQKIELPSGLTSIGESAFEASALSSITLPASLKTIGERAFAYCRALTTVLIPSKLEGTTPIGKWAFKACESLSKVAINKEVKSIKNFDAMYKAAFEDSAMPKSDKAEFITYVPETSIKVWRYIYDTDIKNAVVYDKEAPEGSDKKVAKPYKTEIKSFGDKYSYKADAIDGYVLDTANCKEEYKGTVINLGEKKEFKFYYKKAQAPKPAETMDTNKNETTNNDKPAETEEGIGTGTVIALCIFGVVIVGVVVGAIFVIRSDKKGNKSTTVRKNGNNQKKK